MENLDNDILSITKNEELSMYFVSKFRGNTSSFDLQTKSTVYAFILFEIYETNSKSELKILFEKKIKDLKVKDYIYKILDEYDFSNLVEETKLFNKIDLKEFILKNEIDMFGNYGTPNSLVKLVYYLMNINNNESVLDIGSGTGNFLTYVSEKNNSSIQMGIDVNILNIIISTVRSLTIGREVEYVHSNITEFDFESKKFDKIFSNPPFGIKWQNLSSKLKHSSIYDKYISKSKSNLSGEWLFALLSLISLKPNGKSIVLMSNSGLFNIADKHIREQLLQEKKIETIISLPSNLFEKTAISTSLVILSNNNESVRFVDATNIFTKGRRVNSLEDSDIESILNLLSNDTKYSKNVDFQTIQRNECLLIPSRYLFIEENPENSIYLGELVKSINRGAILRSASLDNAVVDEETNFKYLMLKNIQDGIVDKDLPNLESIDKSLYKYCIKDQNLIISKISPFKIAKVQVANDTKILANGNLYFIEINESKINPTYLEFYLQSEKGIEQLERLSKGSTIKNISISDLKMIQIPILPLNKQADIASQYIELKEDLKVLNKQIKINKEKIRNLIEEVH